MKKILMLAMALAVALSSAGAAGLSVPEFAMLTNGRVNDAGLFVLSTRMGMDLTVEGGAKFAAWVRLSFTSTDLESYFASLYAPIATMPDPDAIDALSANRGFGVQTAAVALQDVLGTPLELTLFAGRLDEFCSGNDFPALFGTKAFSTKLKGFMYFPEGINGDPSRWYDGLHTAYGTGMRLSLPGESVIPYLYVYQDLWLGEGVWSVDARVLFNTERIKLEGFAGASVAVGQAGLYRGGLLFHYDTGAIGDFYAQVGVPRWDPMEAFGPEHLYFMFEPRIDFGFGSLNLSLFFHPAWYLQAATGEDGNLEMRVDLNFGDMDEKSWLIGADTLVSYRPESATEPFVVEASGYVQTVKNGVRIDAKVTMRAFPLPDFWYGIFMPSIGLTTSF